MFPLLAGNSEIDRPSC